MVHMTKPRPFLGCFAARALAHATINLATKFEVSVYTHYKHMKGDTKCQKWGIWGSYGHPRLPEIAPIDRAHTSS